MNPLGLEYLTVIGCHPIDYVRIAAEIGCSHVAFHTKALDFPGMPPAAPSIFEDAWLRNEVMAVIEDHGLAVHLVDGFGFHDRDGEDEGELMLLDSFADLALFYDDLLDALGLPQAIVAGRGFGGMAAAEFAAHYPHRVSRLILIGSYGLWIDDNPVTDIHSADLPEVPHLLFADGDGRIARDVVHGPDGSDPSMYWLQTSLAEAACTHFYWPIPDRDLQRRLYRISAPTLLLWGSEDQIVPTAYADAFAARLRRSEIKLIAGGSHFVHLERAEEAVRAIAEFVGAQTEPA